MIHKWMGYEAKYYKSICKDVYMHDHDLQITIRPFHTSNLI